MRDDHVETRRREGLKDLKKKMLEKMTVVKRRSSRGVRVSNSALLVG